MAFSIAMSSVWDGAIEVVKGMVDPAAFQAMVYTSLATCMALLVLPEPTSKALMVAITVGLCTYLGWSTVWGILQGWKRMSAEAKSARTFDELSAAGERFGKLLGVNTARVMVMVATTALGSAGGTVWKAAGPKLPGWSQAARLATADGLAPALAAPARWVMAAGGELTVGLAVGSNVVMAAQAPTGAGESSNGGSELNWGNWRSQPTFGHAFSRHGQGSRNTENLRGRAGGTGTPQGQWINNEAAAQHLRQVRPELDGPTVVPIPEGMGQVIMPDGSIVPAHNALVVPKANGGIETAYPVLGPKR